MANALAMPDYESVSAEVRRSLNELELRIIAES
jgi:hypothetical protein